MLLTMETIRSRLADRRLHVVAQETGINYDRLLRLVSAKQEAREEDLARLTAYLERTST